MVVENLQITPLMEWLLGAGWHQGGLWQPAGIVVLAVLLTVGGLGLLTVLRRSSDTPGQAVSMWVGGLFGGLSLLVLAAVVLCSTAKTREFLTDYIANPVFHVLAPLLGTEWSGGALYTWLAVAAGLTGIVYAVCWSSAIVVGGPLAGTRQCGAAVAGIFSDIAHISPRRVYALAWLAVRESIRRRVVVVFVVFVILILFAALFINKDSLHPGQLYIQVVLNFTIGLSMLFAWILSALSLPADIRDRTLHTVVTKPVRKLEIVLGRVLGFVFVGSVLLAGIGVISYVFTVRSLSHTHQLTVEKLEAKTLPGNRGTMLRGATGKSHAHEHEVTIIVHPDGSATAEPKGSATSASGGQAAGGSANAWADRLDATVEMRKDHTHDLYVSGSGDTAVYTLGPPVGQLQARVPIYGKLAFHDKTGADKDKGINVGDEWTYRSFIEGRTSAAAIWTFSGLRADMFPESRFPNGIPVEMTLEVFRTYKGDQERGVAGTISLENPDTHKKVFLRNFSAKKFATDVQIIPRSFVVAGSNGRAETIDLFRDMVSSDGGLQIVIQCLEPQQYFGMAQPDLYIRAADSSFAWNFFKGYLGIWLQMALVIGLGVMFSTFLSGPVALLATIFVVICGLFSSYIMQLAGGSIIGGGPFESITRIMTQDNLTSQMAPGMQTNVIKAMDQVTALMLRYFAAVVPDISTNDFVDRVACGFDVGPDLLTRCFLCEAAYLLPVILLGYICLKQREVAQ